MNEWHYWQEKALDAQVELRAQESINESIESELAAVKAELEATKDRLHLTELDYEFWKERCEKFETKLKDLKKDVQIVINNEALADAINRIIKATKEG